MLGNERVHVVEHSAYLALERERDALRVSWTGIREISHRKGVELDALAAEVDHWRRKYGGYVDKWNDKNAECERLTAEVEVSRQWELEHLERAEKAEAQLAGVQSDRQKEMATVDYLTSELAESRRMYDDARRTGRALIEQLEAVEVKYKLEINSHAAEGEVVWARVTDLEAKLKRELALSERLRAALTDILHEGNLATQGKWDATHEIKALAYKALERGE